MSWAIKDIFRRKSVHYYIIMAMLFLGMFLPYPLEPMTEEHKQEILEPFEERVTGITASAIFGNNMMICMLELIPLFGLPVAMRISYNTGIVMKALSPAWHVLLFNPVLWIEMVAYAYSTLQGIYLFFSLIQKRFQSCYLILKHTIFVCAVLLWIGALFEMLIIAVAI